MNGASVLVTGVNFEQYRYHERNRKGPEALNGEESFKVDEVDCEIKLAQLLVPFESTYLCDIIQSLRK